MTTCPYCGEKFSPHILVCPKEIARGKSKETKRSQTKATEDKKKTYLRIKQILANPSIKGTIVNTDFFLLELDLFGKTEGDTIRIILDNLVCEGILSKTEFNCRKGHQYKVNTELTPCKYAIAGTLFFGCSCPKEEFKDIGEFKQ